MNVEEKNKLYEESLMDICKKNPKEIDRLFNVEFNEIILNKEYHFFDKNEKILRFEESHSDNLFETEFISKELDVIYFDKKLNKRIFCKGKIHFSFNDDLHEWILWFNVNKNKIEIKDIEIK